MGKWFTSPFSYMYVCIYDITLNVIMKLMQLISMLCQSENYGMSISIAGFAAFANLWVGFKFGKDIGIISVLWLMCVCRVWMPHRAKVLKDIIARY